MPFASGHRTELRYVQESAEGTTPASDMTVIPHANGGDTIGFSADTAQSDNVSSDLQATNVVRQSVAVNGGHSADALYGAFDIPIRNVFNEDAWPSGVALTAQTDIAASNAGNKLTSATADKFNSFAVGQVVRISGFVNAANNGFARVTAVVTGGSPELGLSTVDIDLVDEAATPSVTVEHDGNLKPATDLVSLSVERAYRDVTYYEIFKGIKIGTWNFRLEHPGRVRFEFADFVGMSTDGATATFGTGTENAAPANRVFQTIDGPILLCINGTKVTLSSEILRTFNFQVQSPAIPLSGAGNGVSSAAQAVLKDNFRISGSFTFYKSASSFIRGLIDDLHDDGTVDLLMVLSDRMPSPNAYAIHIPEAKVLGPSPRNQAQVTLEMGWLATKNATTGFQMGLTKFTTYQGA